MFVLLHSGLWIYDVQIDKIHPILNVMQHSDHIRKHAAGLGVSFAYKVAPKEVLGLF